MHSGSDFDDLRTFPIERSRYSRSPTVAIIKAASIVLLTTVSTKMNNGGQLYIRKDRAGWTTLMAIIVFVVTCADASIPTTRRHERAFTHVSEDTQLPEQKQPKDVVQELITYDGSQVWRIHKPEENNSYVNELVKRYDEDGCT